jgi:uncharacterized protein
MLPMNAPLPPAVQRLHTLADAVSTACERIAPTWPLDRMIAVNPYWGWRALPAAQAAAELGTLIGTRLTAPSSFLTDAWRAGRLRPEHLQAAATRASSPSVDAPAPQARIDATLHARMEATLQGADQAGEPHRLPMVTDLCDAHTPAHHPTNASERVVHQIGQHCAAYFDQDQARWHLPRDQTLWDSWRHQLAQDRGQPWKRGRGWAQAQLLGWPAEPLQAIGELLDALAIAPAARAAYCTALLCSVGGWAAWCAGERWQARLAQPEGGDDEHIVHLLAIRCAWEWLLLNDAAPEGTADQLAHAWADPPAAASALATRQQLDWVLQEALELAYQQPLHAALRARGALPAPASEAPPRVQAVFCIDVRSEVFRRALEAANPTVHTRGFAGFFGLPIAYAPAGSALARPQLPGLLAPALTVSDGPTDEGTPLAQRLRTQRQSVLALGNRWDAWRGLGSSAFSFVETCGLGYGAALLRNSLPREGRAAGWEHTGRPGGAAAAQPRLALAEQDPAAAATMARGILHAMGLESGFAPIVLLAGHGSHSENNPQAAGLDCGACGGQTGEVNARVLAGLLNTPAVRQALAAEHGVCIPDGTHFVPALHNTTTDEVQLFDTDAVPRALAGELRALRFALSEAGAAARRERAAALGESATAAPDALAAALRRRANDWSQTRPEWGLADNAAFIVAPRARTRGLNLGGRSFLHDYSAALDPDGSVLELIMTAPMVVTNWINLQYHACTVDNRRFGSGDKVLHNVVGGRIGVFEGNGGDLRIGLALQSLHDGQRWRHTPLRLSVYIEAPQAMIDAVLARHEVVRQLVFNGWLHLLQIDPASGQVWQRRPGGWEAAA